MTQQEKTPEKLINEDDLHFRFETELACYIGLNEAVLIQRLYRLMQQEKMGRTVVGVKWIRMTHPDWVEELPFFDEGVIRRTLANLIEDGLVHSCTFEGRSKWYTVDLDAVRALDGPVERLTAKQTKRQKAAQNSAEKRVSEQNVQIEDSGNVSDNTVSIRTLCTDTSEQNVQSIRTKCSASKNPSKSPSKDSSPNGEGDKSPPPVDDKPKGYTVVQREILELFGAKRFRTPAAADTVRSLEQAYGSVEVKSAAEWCAKKQMAVGDAIVAMETMLKNRANGKSVKPSWASPNGRHAKISPEQQAQIEKARAAGI